MDVLPPDPVADYDDLAAGLQRVRLEAGVSYRELHRRVVRDRRRRRIPELPAYDTVYRCLQTGRTRLDLDLVLDIVRALGGGPTSLTAWRAAWSSAARQRLASTAGDAALVRDLHVSDTPHLVGRDAERARLLDRPGRWLLTGMPGVGKSALAVAAATELVRSGRADSAVRLQLNAYSDLPVPSPWTVTEALLLHLGTPAEDVVGTTLAERGAQIAGRLAQRRVVLLLDDAGDSEQQAWLPAAADQPESWLLVTSRRQLDLPDSYGIVELAPLTPADGLRVLAPSAAEHADPAVRRLVDLTGGLPLALVLTRSRIAARPDWSLADHADQIAALQRSGRLDPGIDAGLALSYAELGAEEARIYRTLGALPWASVTPALLAPVVGISTPAPILASLEQRSLLQSAGTGRYALHDVVRVHADARGLEQDPPSVRRTQLNRLLDAQAAATGAAMAGFSPHEVHRQPALPPVPAGITFADDETATRWLEDERANLLQAIGYAQRHPGAHDRPQHVVRMSLLLFRYLDLTGWYDDAERLHGWASAAAVDSDERARALNQWGITAWSTGRLGVAEKRLGAALEIYREAGDVHGEGRVLMNLAGISRDRGDTSTALAYGYRALEIAVAADDPAGQSVAHNNLGVAHEQANEHAEALAHHRATLDLTRELGDRFGEARALANLADILLALGERAEARRLQTECLELARDLRFDQAIADSLNNLATMDSLAGRHRAAIDGHEEALAVAERRGLGTEVITRHLAASRDRARAAGRTPADSQRI